MSVNIDEIDWSALQKTDLLISNNVVTYGFPLLSHASMSTSHSPSQCKNTISIDKSLKCPLLSAGVDVLSYLQNITHYTICGYELYLGMIYVGDFVIYGNSCSQFKLIYSNTADFSKWSYALHESIYFPIDRTEFPFNYYFVDNITPDPSNLNSRFVLAYDTSYCGAPDTSSAGLSIVFHSGTLAADFPFDGSICPDYDTGGEDTLYTGQDVFDAMDSVLEADFTDVVIDVGLLADILTEQGIGKDIALNITQSDVIPDAIAKELDKVTPAPSPTPSSSPEPSPTPKPGEDIPKGMLMPDVTKKFPFCLPFDLIKIVEVFNAEAKPLYFEIPLDIPFLDFHYTMVCDFSDFEPVSAICRIFITLRLNFCDPQNNRCLIWILL